MMHGNSNIKSHLVGSLYDITSKYFDPSVPYLW